jgi:hypothetical protein
VIPRTYTEAQRRPSHRTGPEKVDQLRQSWNPAIGYFEVATTRHEAREIRRWLIGSKGLKDIPQEACTIDLDLPHGWTLRLLYDEPSSSFSKAGGVVAVFIPPGAR